VDTLKERVAVQILMEATMKSLEVQLNEALAENVSLKDVIHQKQITIAKLQRDELLWQAGLPQRCVQRLNSAFATSTDNAGLKQAINCERRGVQ
jgi:hypothetical protein